jgi:hypothetical protein
MKPEARKGISNLVGQLGEALEKTEQRKALQEQQREITVPQNDFSFFIGNGYIGSSKLLPANKTSLFDFDIPGKPSTALTVTKPTLPVKSIMESDAEWRNKLVHPSIVLILGKRGSGKSALGYRLLELFRYGPKPYVIGLPASARAMLPDWVGMVPYFEDLPNKAIAIIDEAYLHYHARGSMAQENKAMSQAINLSRQKEQTIIFVTQEARQVDRNIASSANIIIFKDLGILQLEFDRPELNRLASQANKAFNSIHGDRHRWSYVYAPDSDFQGLMENELPSFWKTGLSRIFASGIGTPVIRDPQKLTVHDKARKAKELRDQGASYSEIARALGVAKGSIFNYLKRYPQ